MYEQLVSEAKNGNQEALARLLYDNYEIVFKFLIKFTLNKSAAEDLVQETMVRAIEKIDMYDSSKSKFSTWLIAVAQNIYIDSLRRKKREQRYIDEDAEDIDLYEQLSVHDDLWERLLDALGHLSEEARTALVLKHYHGYSLEEIARLMSVPLGTVKSRIHNAIKTIRKELE